MRWISTSLIALVAGFAGAALWSFSGLGDNHTRDYLLSNPEVLPQAMEELQRRDTLARIEPLRDELEAAFPGAVLGNPDGAVTLVEFTDYACTYCRQSVADVNALIASNPDLKVVVREYPILTEQSADAARMALAAAQQGRFEQFHLAMFAQGQVTQETITAAATQAGVDVEQALAAISAGQFESQLQNNIFLAQSLGITGTPSWIVGDKALNGAIGAESIGRAIAEARDS
ncbi:DsbA family protein [Alteraurantiacibacter aestuarii]|uniref:Thioredoxin domain-containing protein n=1 Tax=Alteraurantiacibacter aestuarii TaxID=650004 RepID=A0A844ZLS0_9SPHN|nr:DsbA family protein [Alteraurantiacibacter aestuarii]MXO88533.1 thioredoxin domain-containing protein [Alteraurantiacibacter aestuarii]